MKTAMRPWKTRKKSSAPAAAVGHVLSSQDGVHQTFHRTMEDFLLGILFRKSVKKIKEKTEMQGRRKWGKDFSSFSAVQVDPCALNFSNASEVWGWKGK